MDTIAAEIMDILEQVTGTDQVRRDPGLALFDLGILDSLGTVEVMVALSDKFSVDISPAEIEREQWATPAKIIAYVEERLGQ